MSSFAWTDELREYARKRFLDDGWSYEAIAREVGAPSRSAVCGVLYRMRVARRGDARRASASPPPQRAQSAPDSSRETREVVALREARPAAPPPPPVPPLRPRLVTAGEPRRLLEIGPCMCRWPVRGEGAEMLCCAAPGEPGSSYCTAHRKLSGQRERSPAEAERYARSAQDLAKGRRRAAAAGGSR